MNTDMTKSAFLNDLMSEISKKDKLHSKKIIENTTTISSDFPDQYEELIRLVRDYFVSRNLSTEHVANDYLKMVNDMRREGLYFYKHGTYRCENQKSAKEYVYSKPDVMTYYMNALLVSQIMWKHHFYAFVYYQSKLKELFQNAEQLDILDVGPGHGFFSYLLKKEFPDYHKMDLVDISDTSLNMTKSIIGYDGSKINYRNMDVFDYSGGDQYDFIVLGEVLEHLDKPHEILQKLALLLNPNGLLWLTTPTNAPAIDHVYLFKTKEEIFDLIEESGLDIVDSCSFFAEDVDEQTALKLKITNLVGVFCKNK
jgi:2-polyprenyl-3-methyl-5-hydroxy-6-metoxy-1,4-benzoquinol methylase